MLIDPVFSLSVGDYTQGSPGAPILHPDVASIQPPLQHHFPQDATPFNTGLLPQNIALCMPGRCLMSLVTISTACVVVYGKVPC